MDKKVVKPMDDGIRERSIGEMRPNAKRQCWAIKTLVAEVHALFPETVVSYDDYDGRNTALSVTFQLDGFNTDTDADDLHNLLALLGDPAHNEDQRIERVTCGDDEVCILMRSDPRTQDSREPFGLADALSVLSGEDEGYADDGDDEDWSWVGEATHSESFGGGSW